MSTQVFHIQGIGNQQDMDIYIYSGLGSDGTKWVTAKIEKVNFKTKTKTATLLTHKTNQWTQNTKTLIAFHSNYSSILHHFQNKARY